MDDTLLASNDMALSLETKSFLSKNFEMKDLGRFFCDRHPDLK